MKKPAITKDTSTEAITVKDLMTETGMAERTLCLAIQKRGCSKPGIKTVLTREQADCIKKDLITNATQYKTGEGNKAMSHVSGTVQGSLAQSKVLQVIKIAEDMKQHYEAVIKCKEALIQCKDEIIADITHELNATQQLLERRTAGLKTIQRIAEAGNLIITDREDIENTYRRNRER